MARASDDFRYMSNFALAVLAGHELASSDAQARQEAETALSHLPPHWQGYALSGAGHEALGRGDLALARTYLERSLPLLRSGEDNSKRAAALFNLAATYIRSGGQEERTRAGQLLHDCLPLFEQCGDAAACERVQRVISKYTRR